MTDAMKTASKRTIKKTTETAGDLIGNKIADKITSASKQPSQNDLDEAKSEIEIPRESIYLQKKDNELLLN